MNIENQSVYKSMILKSILSIIVICLSIALTAQPDEYLIPHRINGKYGFINLKGKTIIPHKYHNAKQFSEGLAGVRENGLFGFIDTKGVYVLPPKYDYVDTFSNGYAKVWIDGKCQVINKKGEELFKGDYKTIERYKSDLFWVTTKTYKTGLINVNETILVDTMYSYLYESDYVDVDNGCVYYQGRLGNAFILINEKNELIQEPFDACSKIKKKPKKTFSTSRIYELKRTFSKNELKLFYPNNGHPVNQQVYEKYEFRENRFTENAIVAIKNNKNQVLWGVIDTMGKFVIPPNYQEIQRLKDVENYFVLRDTTAYSIHSLYDLKRRKTILPKNKWYFYTVKYKHPSDNRKSVTLIKTDDFESPPKYFTVNGEFIYEVAKKNADKANPTINIDYVMPGYYTGSTGNFYAISDSIQRKLYPDLPREIDAKQNTHPTFNSNKLSLFVDTSVIDYYQNFVGYKMYLANTTKDTVAFITNSSRFNLIMQAKDKSGNWKIIQYFDAVGCGNSYHYRILQPNGYWEMAVPIFDGDFKTEMRMVLIPAHPLNFSKWKYRDYHQVSSGVSEKDKTKWIYSNTFYGSVNPGQFWLNPRYKY